MNDELKEVYREYANLYTTNLIFDNIKESNEAWNELWKIYRKNILLKFSKEETKEFYKELLNDENIYVKIGVAIQCTCLKICIKESLKILKKISKDKKTDISIRLEVGLALYYYKKEMYRKVLNLFSMKKIMYKKNKNNDELKELYEDYTILHIHNILLSVISTNSKNTKIPKIYERILTELDESERKYLYIDLLKSSNSSVRFIAAAQCLALNIFIKRSIRVLKKITRDKYYNSTIRKAAKITLETYRKQGDLKFY